MEQVFEMTPIFYSQYSGKSLLTYQTVEDAKKYNKQSLFKICKENDIQNPVVVDTRMTGFMELITNAKKEGITPRFGLNYRFVHDESPDHENNWHRVIVFIKNDQGYKDLVKLHNTANIEHGGKFNSKLFKDLWTENLKLSVPFYDSYIFKNTMGETGCIPDFGEIPFVHFVERNELPFDDLIENKIRGEKMLVKSIYYENREDFKKWLTYRCSLNYSVKGKNRTIKSPMFDHCHSHEFSFESYVDFKEAQ